MIRALVVAALLASPVMADAPEVSPFPVARGDGRAPTASPRPRARDDLAAHIVEAPSTEAETAALAEAIAVARTRPALRPASEQMQGEAALGESMAFVSLPSSVRPGLRPGGLEEKAMAKRRLRRRGAVCGDIDIQGEEVGRVPGRIRACGIKDAVRVRSVSGISLSQSALINCKTAKALKRWVDKGVVPAFGRRDRVVGLKVAAHYACRTRNNQKGARISEHGKDNAIDISGFHLESGRTVTVLEGWNGKAPLRRIHKAACGPFGTVLGPRADRYHRDHFHLDTARHRGGPYCR